MESDTQAPSANANPAATAAAKRATFRARRFAFVWCIAAIVAFTITGRFAWLHKCPTFDEPLHFVCAWLQTHNNDLRCNPEDPPLWKYYVAVGTRADDLRARDPGAQTELYYTDLLYHGSKNNDVDGLIAAGRMRMLLLGAFLAGLIAWWAWRLAGPVAAVVAITAFCFDPNFLAHAPLIKNDVPITLIFLGLMAAVWLLGERATLLRWFVVSLLIGAALTTKFSGVLAIPMLGMALFIRAILPVPWQIMKWTLATRWSRFLAAVAMGAGSLLVAYVIIWACYDFRFFPVTQKFNDPGISQVIGIWAEHQVFRQHGYPQHLKPGQLLEWSRDWQPDLYIQSASWIYAHHLLPETWIVGFIYTSATSVDRPSFLCGQISMHGWWYYFPCAMAFKTPFATLVGIALTLGWAAWRLAQAGTIAFRRAIAKAAWPVCAMAIAPILYMAVAMSGNLNLGIRHILPVYPFLFIMLGVVAAHARRRNALATWSLIAILGTGLIVETYHAYPNYIPFFNVAAGGSEGGLTLLSDSNIDWGQELPDLADWQAHNEDRQLYLAYFGAADPSYYGIHFRRMAEAFAPETGNLSSLPLKPVFAISAVNLQGQYLSDADRKLYEPFRRHLRDRIAVLGGSLYIFNLPPQLDTPGAFGNSQKQ